MILHNKTKGKGIVNRIRKDDSVFFKFRGLMFSKQIRDEGLVFVFSNERRIDLHMFFVFFPIDVLFLNQEKIIVEKKENFRPFTFYYSKTPAKYVIELPHGCARGCDIGDKLEF